MKTVRRVVFAAICTAIAVVACNTNTDGIVGQTGNPADGGSSKADATSSGVDDSLDPRACELPIAYDKRCADSDAGASDACAVARKADCSKLLPTESAAYRNAAIKCFTQTVACGKVNECLVFELANAVPTQTQTKVRNDFCTTCGMEAGPNCADNFFRLTADGAGDGLDVLLASDAVGAYIDAKCTGSALDLSGGNGSCREAFVSCAAGIVQAAAPQMPQECEPPPPPLEEDAGDGAAPGDGSTPTDATTPTEAAAPMDAGTG